MLKYLLKATEEYYLDSKVDVDDFQRELESDAAEQGYVVQSFAYAEKACKGKDRQGETYFKCKVVKLFNDEKDPDLPLRKVFYTGFHQDTGVVVNDPYASDIEDA